MSASQVPWDCKIAGDRAGLGFPGGAGRRAQGSLVSPEGGPLGGLVGWKMGHGVQREKSEQTWRTEHLGTLLQLRVCPQEDTGGGAGGCSG